MEQNTWDMWNPSLDTILYDVAYCHYISIDNSDNNKQLIMAVYDLEIYQLYIP